MKILCTGDVHIGRRSTKLPPGTDSRHHSCAAAWLRIVDLAIAESVDVVAATGDLVDQSNRFFEAFGPVEAGLKRLSSAGITTVMVAGNHDFDVLPRIAETVGMEHVRLLGRGGEWERLTIERRGERLHVDGWSFAREHHPLSPIASYPGGATDGSHTVALVHGDLDQPRSPYAPISLPEMRRHPGTFFLLGHVHARRLVEEPGGARALYPGSPQAMDPAETAGHGVYLLDVDQGAATATFLPLSTVRYELLEVLIDNVERAEEVDEAIVSRIRYRLGELGEESHLRHVRFRVRLAGRTPLHRHLDSRLKDRVTELEIEAGRLTGSVDRLVVDTRPARDLAALAAAGGAPAILAQLIRGLEQRDAEFESVVGEARQAVREIERASVYLPVLEPVSPGEDEEGLRRELGRAAALLLDEMLAQKESE